MTVARRVGMQRKTPLKRATSTRRRGGAPTDFSKTTKQAITVRSGGRCEARWDDRCVGVGQVFHHVLRRSQGGRGTVDNGAHLCRPCHDRVHAHPADAYARGLLQRSGS